MTTREPIRVGRLTNPDTVFQNNFEEELRSPGTAIKIGKLDLTNIFEKKEENEEEDRNPSSSIRKVGKLKLEVNKISYILYFIL